jgi:hypothetical protein
MTSEALRILFTKPRDCNASVWPGCGNVKLTAQEA